MIRLNAHDAQQITGGQATYTWYAREQYDRTRCVYDRYKHEADKFGRETGVLNFDGSELLACRRGSEFTGTSSLG